MYLQLYNFQDKLSTIWGKKTMKKHEAGFQIKFKHWLEANPPKTSTAYELKFEHSGRFNIFQWTSKQPHQLRGLLESCLPGEMCYHKISDASYEKKPYDCFVMTNAEAYLVIYFEKEQSTLMCNAKMIHNLLTSGITSATFSELLEKGAQKIKV